METFIDIQNNINILTKINYLKKQIALRESIPYNERTEKQLVKLDNLQYELKKLDNILPVDD
jgi:hypothetical protein